jgi:hypothetical protein
MEEPSATSKSPVQVRKDGLVNAGVGIGGILFGRLLVEILLAMGIHEPMVGGAMIVLFPVIGAFGLTSVIVGRDQGWFRIPLVVVLSIALIAFAFYVIIPAGYQLAP